MPFNITTKEEFENFITANWNQINQLIDKEMEGLPIPIYSSVDIREGKLKFAPVDHNMYPAGFNNVCSLDLEKASEVFEETIKNLLPECKNIAIITEAHTKNLFYLDHLVFLGKTLREAGFRVHFTSLTPAHFENSEEELELLSFSKFDITIHKGEIKNGELYANSQKIDFAILNNDQSEPLEQNWDEIKTPIHPTPKIGWYKREKIRHFTHYQNIVEKISKEFSFDPNLISAKFRNAYNVDFSTKEGIEELANEVDDLLKQLPPESNVFVKASRGTYGMGISVVKSGAEIISMNKKMRNKMNIGKNKIKFTSLIIQEGVETVLKYDNMPAEVTIYLVNGKSVGGFMRANTEKDAKSNLNAKGMVFKKYCISEIRENSDFQQKEAVYSIIARLATLASAYEIQEIL